MSGEERSKKADQVDVEKLDNVDLETNYGQMIDEPITMKPVSVSFCRCYKFLKVMCNWTQNLLCFQFTNVCTQSDPSVITKISNRTTKTEWPFAQVRF